MTNQLLQLGMPLLKSIIPSFGLKNILSHLYSSISSGDAVLTDWQSESSMGRMLLMILILIIIIFIIRKLSFLACIPLAPQGRQY